MSQPLCWGRWGYSICSHAQQVSCLCSSVASVQSSAFCVFPGGLWALGLHPFLHQAPLHQPRCPSCLVQLYLLLRCSSVVVALVWLGHELTVPALRSTLGHEGLLGLEMSCPACMNRVHVRGQRQCAIPKHAPVKPVVMLRPATIPRLMFALSVQGHCSPAAAILKTPQIDGLMTKGFGIPIAALP